MTEEFWLALLFLAPLTGFLINGLNFKSKNYKLAGGLATGAMVVSFTSALVLFFRLLELPSDARSMTIRFFPWIEVGSFQAPFQFLFDPISALMILIITGVGTLIHLFSIGYMSHDERPAKYFAYLNFFIVNMSLLVLGDNLMVTFIGWEGVGLCSYLLIGFWFTDPQKAAAGMKAFITNRIGDAGLLLGIFILFSTFGTVNYLELNQLMTGPAEAGWAGPITLATLLLFVGATGKSAQIPLYVWLPDAMAGPTPVSALIHAATMVTAGVYLIVRMSPVFVLAPNTMMIIAVIGALTALLAATIGATQWDIKKVLAYSTVSQLGYMFLGVGVGAFIPAMFHLMTHAFFKALMFLGSGSVIHGMHHEQDMRKMGGLAKIMPITHATFFIGWLAICGIPPFSGFFSKDEILWYSFSSTRGHFLLWLIGAVAAGITAFYMTRLMVLTFWSKSRVDKSVKPHESPFSMTFPLMVLAALSAIGGWIGIPHVIGEHIGHIPNVLKYWLKPAVATLPPGHGSASTEIALMIFSVALATASIFLARHLYLSRPEKTQAFVSKFSGFHKLVSNKYFVDEFYFANIINPIVSMSKALWNHVDVQFIDKMTFRLSDLAKESGQAVRALQSGRMQSYAFYILLGVFALIYFALMS